MTEKLEMIREYPFMVWKAIPVAALAAGTAFLLIVGLLSSPLIEVRGTLFLRYFASLVMGEDVVSGDVGMTVYVVGVLVHYGLSLLFTLLIALSVHRWGLRVGIGMGAVLGLSLWAVNFYTVTFFFEWMFAINNWLLIVAHVIFGAVAGGVYEMLDDYDKGIDI